MSSLRHLRSSTASKRPAASGIADGQLAINTASGTPGLFFKDNASGVVKIGPAHVGATAPNATPAGSAGNSVGEMWLDTATAPSGLKVWTGADWLTVNPSGTTTTLGVVQLATSGETASGTASTKAVTPLGLQGKLSDSISNNSSTSIASSAAVKTAYDLANAAVPASGGVITGTLEIGPSGSIAFEGSGVNTFETTISVVDPTADRTILFPDVSGTVVTTGDNGTITGTMISGNTIANANIATSAAIVDSKLATISGANKVNISSIDIDGATDIGASLVDGDLLLVDDGGGGANRKSDVNRVPVYVFSKVSGDIAVTSSGVASISSGVIVDADISASAAISLSKLATGALPTGITVSSGNIVDGTISNTEINASAAISLSKLATGALPSGITVTRSNITSPALADGDIASTAAIAYSKLASLTAANILLGNASNVATSTAITGDISITSSGVTAISAGAIVDADVNASAAIGLSKLATGALPTGITVSSGNIVDGTIGDGEINANAAIALSKLATGALPSGITINTNNIVDSTITNSDISGTAAIAHSKLASITAGSVLLGNSSNVPTVTALSGDIAVDSTGLTSIASGVIVNADINASAAIAHSKLASITAGSVLLGNASNVPTATALSGDITVGNTGVTAISSGVIVDNDINASAAIAHSKLANITAGSVLLGNASNVPTATALSGDVTISNTGVTAIASGVIVNADIKSDAAIVDTKLATISTAGKVSNSATTATDANTASAIVARDANGNFNTTSINNGPLAGFRNAIINGTFDVWQRGTSISVTADYTYTADRWVVSFNGTGATRTVSFQSWASGGFDASGEPSSFLRFAQSAAGTGSTINRIDQRIEFVRSFAGQQVTVSFWAKAAANTTMPSVTFLQYFGTGGTPAATTTTSAASNVALTTAWQKFSYQATIPSISGKAIGSNGDHALILAFNLPLNATFTIDFARVQVESGPIATEFERRSYTQELQLCQRYYQITTGSVRGYATGASQNFSNSVNFATPMRAIPNPVSLSGGSVSNAAVSLVNANIYGVRHEILSNALGDSYSIDRTVTANAEL